MGIGLKEAKDAGDNNLHRSRVDDRGALRLPLIHSSGDDGTLLVRAGVRHKIGLGATVAIEAEL